MDTKPDVVVVVGDINSTIACGLVVVKSGIELAHIEAGLRSFDRSMPEEINQALTDAISDFLFCTEQSGIDNLLNEGITKDKVRFVGNVMIDTLLNNRAKAQKSTILDQLSVDDGKDALLTLHRPTNVDDPQVFGNILETVDVILKDMPVIFPVHPRTRTNLNSATVGAHLGKMTRLRLAEPLGYLNFLKTDDLCNRRADRFGRHPGGNDHPKRAMPNIKRKYGTTGDRHMRIQLDRRSGSTADPERIQGCG